MVNYSFHCLLVLYIVLSAGLSSCSQIQKDKESFAESALSDKKQYFHSGSDTDCVFCHDSLAEEIHPHPNNLVPTRKIFLRMPNEFPLTEKGEVDCVTCHDLERLVLEKTSSKRERKALFLRGGPYEDRTDICYKCHKKISCGRLDPHDQISNEGDLTREVCTYCHKSLDKSCGCCNEEQNHEFGEDFVIEDLNDLCSRCHKKGPHPGGVDHNVLLSPEKRNDLAKMAEALSVPLPLGPKTEKIYCATCHNPHEKGVLNGENDLGADDEKRLRLTESAGLCKVCHEK